MDLKTVIYEKKGNIAKIILNRPEKMNAINHELAADLDRALEMAEHDEEVRVVILTGAGRAFCAGYDLTGSPYTSLPAGEKHWTVKGAVKVVRGVRERYLRIWDFPKPTIAQVNGYCLAAGCYLQMLCDLSIATEDAPFGHPAQRIGGVSSMPLWIWLLGPRKAKELLLTGKLIDGREAARIGLVNKAVPASELEVEVMRIAEDLATLPPEGVSLNKEAINTTLEIMGLGATFRYHSHMNAMSRFMETHLDLAALRAGTKEKLKPDK